MHTVFEYCVRVHALKNKNNEERSNQYKWKNKKTTTKILLYSFLDFVDFLFLRVVEVLDEELLDDFFISLIICGLVGVDDVSRG